MLFKYLGYLFYTMNFVSMYFSLENEALTDFGSPKWIISIFFIVLLSLSSFFLFYINDDKKTLQILIDLHFITGVTLLFYYAMVNLLLPIKFERFEDFVAFFSMSATLISIAAIGIFFIEKKMLRKKIKNYKTLSLSIFTTAIIFGTTFKYVILQSLIQFGEVLIDLFLIFILLSLFIGSSFLNHKKSKLHD